MASLDEFCEKVSKGSVCDKMRKVTDSPLARLNFLTSVGLDQFLEGTWFRKRKLN